MRWRCAPTFLKIRLHSLLAASLSGSAAALTYPAYPGCDPLATNDFRMTTLVNKSNDAGLSEPVKMALDMDVSGNVDIYYVQLNGMVKRYRAADKSIATLLDLKLSTAGEDGLVGIALDPAFASNRWVYLFYTHGNNAGTGSEAPEARISRFTLGGNALASEAILLRIPGTRGGGSWHTGGGMQFDAYRDLWVGVGDNHAELNGLPNTNDMRGCILRIHINSDGSMSIPAGNLRSVIRSMPNLAAADTSKVRPEIFVMGCRNPYTLAVDPVRRWLAWGDIGPDVPQKGTGTEEFNLVKSPGFMGWPFFAGDNQVMAVGAGQGAIASSPVNNDPANTGLKQLPPATPPIRPYFRSAAVTGPIYRYDGASASRIKLPPHFNRKWIVSDFNKKYFLALTLDSAGTRVMGADTVWSNGTGELASYAALDIQQGPDGALYVLNYAGWHSTTANTAIRRLEYSGPCRPATPLLETTVSLRHDPALPVSPLPGPRMEGMSLSIDHAGPHRVSLTDASGKTVFLRSQVGARRYALGGLVPPGLYLLRVSTPAGTMQRSIALVK